MLRRGAMHWALGWGSEGAAGGGGKRGMRVGKRERENWLFGGWGEKQCRLGRGVIPGLERMVDEVDQLVWWSGAGGCGEGGRGRSENDERGMASLVDRNSCGLKAMVTWQVKCGWFAEQSTHLEVVVGHRSRWDLT